MMKRAEDAQPAVHRTDGNCPDSFDRREASMHLHVLASGSKGNSAIVETRDTAVLIDCGITKKAFLEACFARSFDPRKITAVIITHEHSDHTKGLGVVLRGLARLECFPSLYTTRGTLDASRDLAKVDEEFSFIDIKDTQTLSLTGLNIQFFPTSHDAADPIGMTFEASHDGVRDVLGYVTDTGVFPAGALSTFKDARMIALESNHDEHMLEIGPYPSVLKRRVASDSGHLSNIQASSSLEQVFSDNLESIIGMHLSETNNFPRIAYAELAGMVDKIGANAAVFTAYQNLSVSIG